MNPRGTETVQEYWQKCAEQINVKFPGSNRKGLFKSLAQRLFVSPQCRQPVTVTSRTVDVGTQTEDQIRTDDTKLDWVFMQPTKDMQRYSKQQHCQEIGSETLKQRRISFQF
ncbi:uncharacterized protein LOC123545268 [Mercenaria mercenaria]|uniref:uncharacterized protein LOC123545268 n=1 Tax=Mercenaria mercenaria TaxID=6596 RepID=UPI001E1DF6F9|nr:uncharacterized protein LOC123545268 [Mercenaria mercenaria]